MLLACNYDKSFFCQSRFCCNFAVVLHGFALILIHEELVQMMQLEVQRWENGRSGNIDFAVEKLEKLEKLFFLSANDGMEKRDPAK